MRRKTWHAPPLTRAPSSWESSMHSLREDIHTRMQHTRACEEFAHELGENDSQIADESQRVIADCCRRPFLVLLMLALFILTFSIIGVFMFLGVNQTNNYQSLDSMGMAAAESEISVKRHNTSAGEIWALASSGPIPVRLHKVTTASAASADKTIYHNRYNTFDIQATWKILITSVDCVTPAQSQSHTFQVPNVPVTVLQLADLLDQGPTVVPFFNVLPQQLTETQFVALKNICLAKGFFTILIEFQALPQKQHRRTLPEVPNPQNSLVLIHCNYQAWFDAVFS